MSAPAPRICAVGTLDALPEFDFEELNGPAESAEVEFDLVNDGATAETMTEVSIGCEESADGGATWGEGSDNSSITWKHMLHVQAIDQDGDGITPQTTGYVPVGVGARLFLDPIPADCRRTLRAKLVVPAGTSTATRKIKFIPYWREPVVPLPQGLFESGQRGVIGGTNDLSFSALLLGGELSASGSPDGNVQIATYAAKVAGVPMVQYAHPEAIAASASGKARWVTLSIAADNTVTATSSSEVTAPAPVDDQPAPPPGEPYIGRIHRTDGDIETADIFQDDVLRAPFHLTVDGLDFVVGNGRSLVDNRIIRRDFGQTGTFADDETTTIFQNPADGSISQVLAGDSPAEAHAEPLWSATAVSGVVTTRDLRRFIGADVVEFTATFDGEVTVGDASHWLSPSRTCYVRLPHGAELAAGDMGDGTGGSLEVDLEQWTGAAWESLFSDAAERPALAFDADPAVATGFIADVTAIAPSTRMRWRVAAVPSGAGTDPSGVTVRAQFEVGY